jgi:hypothetical protein
MNKEDVKNVIRHVFHFYEANNKECNWTEMNEACSEVFRALDQKPDIKVPEGATYGDAFIAMLPGAFKSNYIETDPNMVDYVTIYFSDHEILIPYDLWNSPYKKGEE